MIAALTAAIVASMALPETACRAPLPHGPAVPAPIVFKTSCGGFRLDTSGRVSRLPPRWFAARSGGTGRRHGADLEIRRNRAGRIFILRGGDLLWRSRDLYPNTGGDVAFGPNAFAFAAYRRGVFATDLRSPERLVVPGRGRYPSDFFASGRLIVAGGRAITVLDTDGRTARRYAYSRLGSFGFDGDTNTLYFVTPRGRLATLRESRLHVGRRLNIGGTISVVKPGLLLFHGSRSLAVTARDGRLIAQARWPNARLNVLDSGVSVSPDGRRVAFRLSDARAGAKSGSAVLYLLSAGDTSAKPIYRHRLGPVGCGVGASMRWSGRNLLYTSANEQFATFNTANGRRTDLRRLANALPRRARVEQPLAAWASEYTP